MKRIAALVCAFLLVGVAPAKADDGVQTVLNQFAAQAGPGAAVRYRAGTLSAGTAKIHEQRALTGGDHFRIGSQTKTLTAAVVLQLVHQLPSVVLLS